MNVKKAIKKMVALGTGAALMGATVLGAMAADLSDFPSPFVKNGQFDAMIVIGQSAATADVVGAIDIATTLQYEMREMTNVGDDSVTTVSLSGDSVKISKSNDKLTTGMELYNIFPTIDDEDGLEVLAGGNFGDEDYTEELILGTSSESGEVVFAEPADGDYEDEPGTYLKFGDASVVFTYKVDFESPESDIDTTGTDNLEDFDDETLTLMGKEYTVISTDLDGTDLTIELLGGESTQFLEERATGEFSLGGETYTVEATVVTDEYANLVVNGESVKINIGDSEELDSGIEVGVKDTIVDDDYADVVEFYLGADKIVIQDTDITDSAWGSDEKAIKVGDDTYSNTVVMIKGSNTSTVFTLDEIQFRVTAGENYFLAKGDSLGDFFGGSDYEDDDYLFGNVDFRFEGMTESAMDKVEIMPKDDDLYEISFPNNDGDDVTLELIYTGAASGNLEIGGEDEDLELFEVASGVTLTSATVVQGGAPVLNAHIAEDDDIFLVSTADADIEDRKVNFMKFTDFDDTTGKEKLTFEDVVSGEDIKVELTATNLTSVWTGMLEVEDKDHLVLFNSSTTASQGYVWVSPEVYSDYTTPSSVVGTATVDVPLKSGAYMTLALPAANALTVEINVPADMVEANALQTYSVNLSDSSNEVSVGSVGDDISSVKLYEDDDNKIYTQNSVYGVAWHADTDADPKEYYFSIPHAQILPQVFVTSGSVTASTVEGASGSAYTISPVAAGVAKLDTEVGTSYRNENVIVVGGPCVNTVAAALLGSGADCTEGFSAGKAMVKLVPQGSKVAMIVAGMDADDTRLATKVVHDYKSHSSKFMGMELEVAGTSMSDVTITSMN